MEELYRSLLLAPAVWMREQVGVKPDKALLQIESDLRQQVSAPAPKWDLLLIRQAFQSWLNRLDIDHLSLILDEISMVPPDAAPVLFRMLLDTFPRGGQVILKLGGRKSAVRMGERAKHGGLVGLQLNHDVLVGLDLDELLSMPPAAGDLDAASSDPKQAFLVSCVRRVVPAVADKLPNEERSQLAMLFDPPECWRDLFRLGGADAERIGRSVEILLRQASRFNPHLIERAAQQAAQEASAEPLAAESADARTER
jgi:hypothetical protein